MVIRCPLYGIKYGRLQVIEQNARNVKLNMVSEMGIRESIMQKLLLVLVEGTDKKKYGTGREGQAYFEEKFTG